MASDDNQQYFITIPNSNGETIVITPEILPEQLLTLVQKKQLKEEKVDLSNLASVYKKLVENLAENSSSSLRSISSLNNIINENSINTSRVKPNLVNTDVRSSSLITTRSSIPTIILRHTNNNQSDNNLQSSVNVENSLISGSFSDNSSNYITTLQLSQNSSNLPTLSFTQSQSLLHYSNQNPESTNTLLIPISLHNSNQFPQQQILLAATAMASGEYNHNRGDSDSNALLNSNSMNVANLNATSLAKLISNNVTNNLAMNSRGSFSMDSPNSDVSESSKSSNSKRRSSTTDEFGKRKEIRLIKNREAARECRRKKKEYVKCLENRVANLEQQNKVLVDEINRMKELYQKKTTKNVANAPQEIENKHVNVFPTDNLISEDKYVTTSNTPHPITLRSLANMSSSSVPNVASINHILQPIAYINRALDKQRSPHHKSTNEKVENFPMNNKESSNSNLSVLLCNNSHAKEPYNNAAYSSHSSTFQEFGHGEDTKRADNSL